MPRISRPPDSASRLATCLAGTSGLRWGRITMPVPSFSPVWPARNARATSGSRIGPSGSIGEGGTRGSGSTTCSPAHSDSKPAASATRAIRADVAGRLQAYALIENRPYLTSAAIALAGLPDLLAGPAAGPVQRHE